MLLSQMMLLVAMASTPESDTAKAYWERAPLLMAHIARKQQTSLFSEWRRWWLDTLNNERHALKAAAVAEYGIGAGGLGLLLLKEFRVRNYTGIDISERQLKHAHSTLKAQGFVHGQSYHLHLAASGLEFRTLRADVFISQAVMQHFPSRAYTEAWLANLDRSGIPTLMLQPRWSATPRFNEWGRHGAPRDNVATVRNGTAFDSDFILEHLRNYELRWASAVRHDHTQGYVYYIFARKSSSA